MNRFTKENYQKLVKSPVEGRFRTIKRLFGPILDFSGLIMAVGLFAIYVLTKFSVIIWILLLLSLIYQLVLFYFILIKFNKIKINKYSIDIGLEKEVKFVFVSDIHMGYEYSSTTEKRLLKIINKINDLNTEMVLLGGDFLTHKITPELLEKLSLIKAPNVFAVYGNHDAEYLDPNVDFNTPEEFIKAFSLSKIPLLINKSVEVIINGQKLTVGGIPDLYSKNFNLEETFKNSDIDTKRILMSHNPDIIDFLQDSDNIDLILSGHNHSGQVFLSNTAILPMPTKRKWLTKGLYKVSNRTQLFLSQGIGFSGSRLRIGTDSEICLITLK